MTDETPVVLSKIYTRAGDGGTTMLGDMSRTAKTDPRLIAYADTEEANAAIGLAVALGLPDDVAHVLERVQNELFDVGSDLCRPGPSDHPEQRIAGPYIAWLEEQCDRFNEGLAPLRSFILPGGRPGVAQLHVARTVVRRAERSTWAAAETQEINPMTAKYLNRLSDLLFILCRAAGAGEEILWQPGASRTNHA